MKLIKKTFVQALKKMDLGSAFAIRLMVILGKSKTPIHPKHFLYKNPWFTYHLKKTDITLDLGSGVGQNAIKAARVCKKVTGVELDEKLIQVAEKSTKISKIKNVKFQKANLENKLNFRNNSFSKVIFLDVLEHLHKRDQILIEIKRILKPRGLLLLSVPNCKTSWKKFQRSAGVCSFSDPDHKIEFSEKTITKLLKKNNFKIKNIGYSSYDHFYRGLIDIIGAISLPLYQKISLWRLKKAQENSEESQGFEIVAENIK